MQQPNVEVNRRSFLKGLGITALMLPIVLQQGVFAQQATEVSLYARLAGAVRPPININNRDSSAWICLGDQIELFWVTTPDVGQIRIGSDVGTFNADQGGNENGFNWGSTVVDLDQHTSFQIETLDGNFEALNAANVRVFGQTQAEATLIEEDFFKARLINRTSVRTDAPDSWQVVLPSNRFSNRLGVTEIKPSGAAVQPAQFPWSVTKLDENGTERHSLIVPVNAYQRPFTLTGTNTTVPLSGTWTFSTESPQISAQEIPFFVKPLCA